MPASNTLFSQPTTQEAPMFDLMSYFDQSEGPSGTSGIPVTLIGFTREYSMEYDTYSVQLVAKTDKNGKIITRRIAGHPKPDTGSRVKPNSKLGQFMLSMHTFVPFTPAESDEDQFTTLVSDLNRCWAGYHVRLAEVEELIPVVNGVKGSRSLSGKSSIITVVLDRVSENELIALQQEAAAELARRQTQ